MENGMSELLKLFDKHGCDKGSRKHFYNEVYEPHFEKVRNDPINILEIGVFLGESTAAFHEYFPNANIYGIDIFVRTSPEDLEILKEERVHFIKGDSMDPMIKTQIEEEWPGVKFDIIIDDGAHWPEANRLTFKHTAPFLKEKGKYFVEDVWPIDEMGIEDINHYWIKKNPDRYSQTSYKKFLNEFSFGYISEWYDVRQKTKLSSLVKRGKGNKPEWISDSTIMLIEHDHTITI